MQYRYALDLRSQRSILIQDLSQSRFEDAALPAAPDDAEQCALNLGVGDYHKSEAFP